MSLFRIVGLVLCFGLLLGCETEEPTPEVDVFGNYVLFSVVTENPYDFTDDGIESTDLKGQIGAAQPTLGTTELIVTQRGTMESDVDILNIAIMAPTVLTTLPGGKPLLRYEINRYPIQVRFDQAPQQFLLFENSNPVSSIQLEVGTINEINLINFIQIEVIVEQELYDYTLQDWVQETVTYRFNKAQ